LIVAARDVECLLVRTVAAGRRSPFIEPVGDDQAAEALQRTGKRRARPNRLYAGVDHLQARPGPFRPGRNEPPAQQLAPGMAVAVAGDREHVVARRHVVSGPDFDRLAEREASARAGGIRRGEAVATAHCAPALALARA